MSSVISPGRNIVLIGLMGSGKSTVGRLVADRLDRPFVDTDDVVEHDARRSIAEIFATDGERDFRELESAAVRQVSALRGQVIAVGGGAVVSATNATALRGTGDLVWLDAPISALVMHLTAEAERGTRPLLGDPATLQATLERLYVERYDAYKRAATHILATEGRPPEVLADEVIAWARTRPGLLAREERL
ncbi:shikimate kinase [Euzebya sp.]|uniref:shikimate kinase n=1 Tax=Euzebya sp. TaxID=1971409 RepID=UPI003511FB53